MNATRKPPVTTLDAVVKLLEEHDAIDVLASLALAANACASVDFESSARDDDPELAALKWRAAASHLRQARESVRRAEQLVARYTLAAGADVVCDEVAGIEAQADTRAAQSPSEGQEKESFERS